MNMIKNIVFDIGNVLLTFKPEEYFSYVNRKDICQYIFSAMAWKQYDLGVKTKAEVETALIQGWPEEAEVIHHMLENWEQVLQPKKMIDVLESLRKEGYKVYLLSNLSYDAAAYIKEKYALFELVDGYVLSFEEHVIKPNPVIYEVLVQRYGLRYEESVFIDDARVNVEAAKQLGMYGIHCIDEDKTIKELYEVLAGANHA